VQDGALGAGAFYFAGSGDGGHDDVGGDIECLCCEGEGLRMVTC
jgi:hypothetical protein